LKAKLCPVCHLPQHHIRPRRFPILVHGIDDIFQDWLSGKLTIFSGNMLIKQKKSPRTTVRGLFFFQMKRISV